MAIRKTTHILKNTQTSNKALPTSGILMGEPLVNLFNGILFFSGATSGNYTPFVDPSNATSGGTYFEVGSNVYNLQIRNRITAYNGSTGSQLDGKYLKGTANGFVLDNITNIGSITGFTYVPSTNVLTILQSNGSNPFVTLSAFTGLNLYGSNTVNGSLTVTGNTSLQGVSATNINATNVYASSTVTASTLTIGTLGTYNTVAIGTNPLEIVNFSSLSGYVESNDTYVTGGTVTTPASNSSKTVTVGLNYKRPDGNTYNLTTENTFVTGGTYSAGTITFGYNDSTKPTFQVIGIDGTDTYVTGGTVVSATTSSNSGTIKLQYNRDVSDNTYTLPYTDTFVTGTTLSDNKVYFYRNDGTSLFVDLNALSPTGATALDTYVTGFTYDASSNKLTISQNQGKADKVEFINTFSGLTISNLTAGQVVYVGSDNKLKTESDFLYNDSTNTLTVGTTSGKLVVNNGISDGPSTFGQGGLIVGSGGSFGPSGTTAGYGDLIIHGNFIVFGTGTTVATNELYVEDPQITLNYNPSGGTSITSLGSGIRIQEGSGTAGTDTYFTVARLDTLTGLTATQIPIVTEYASGGVGNSNRGWLTQLNDIVIRNTNLNNGAPNGVRVLAEFDILDGGQY